MSKALPTAAAIVRWVSAAWRRSPKMPEVVPTATAITIRAETLLADPDTCKFTVSQSVYPGGPFFFDSQQRAAGSPLVERLFALAGVANVLVTDNVVTVGKQPSVSWSELKSAIGTAIRTQLLTGVPTILDSPDNRSFTGILTSTRDRRSGKYEVRVALKRDCEATIIPSGEKLTLAQGDGVVVTQALGGSFTVRTERGYLVRVAALDADALGLESATEQAAPVDAGPFTLDKVTKALKTVFDPEIPVNVVDLGLIYVCEAHPLADGGHRVEIKMSMTAPGCGMGDVLKKDAHAKVQAVPGVTEVDIEIVWEPAWDQSRMSEAAQLQLGLF